MIKENGKRPQHLKQENRALVLRAILHDGIRSRTSIAQNLSLTKTALSHLVGELIEDGLLTQETETQTGNVGRRTIRLSLAETAPVICGILIRRGELRVLLADLSGKPLFEKSHHFSGLIKPQVLQDTLITLYREAILCCHSSILAIGIACAGPLNISEGTVSPHGLFTYPYTFRVVSFFQELSGRPAFLCNDATAGALAEKLFGCVREEDSFVYISTHKGIGAGLFLNGKLYNADIGQNGELGHMSIRFDGKRCICGGRGCLRLYANADSILHADPSFRTDYPNHPFFSFDTLDFLTLLQYAAQDDPLACIILDRDCRYLAVAVRNLCTQLSLHTVVLAGLGPGKKPVFSQALLKALNGIPTPVCPTSTIVESLFGMDAPLYGSIGIIVEKIFSGELSPLVPNERTINHVHSNS